MKLITTHLLLLIVSIILMCHEGSASERPSSSLAVQVLAEMPEAVTSFGAAIVGDAVYMYGGHKGRAHYYAVSQQSNELQKLAMDGKSEWKTIATGPRLQGLAMVAHGDKLYRIGGFSARNQDGEEHDLHSRDDVEVLDVKTRRWKALPNLPEPRSSFDAAVLGDEIFVIGGWSMRGADGSDWHKSAYSMNIASTNPRWVPLTTPPFKRRALAVAAHDGKVFAIGGMTPKGPTRQVDIYDPVTREWRVGPKLPGKKDIEGFGCSAFSVGGRLYVSTVSGSLMRYSIDGTEWEVIGMLDLPRFFHRMLPVDSSRLLMLGGASMKMGKVSEIEVIDVGVAR